MTEPAPDVELRSVVAREVGLPDAASSFLTGETMADVEASAVELVKLLGSRQEPAEDEPGPDRDPISAALAAKAQRKRALTQVFTGRAPARDAAGRFTSSGSGFDGGAREPVAARRSPEAEHGALVASLVGLRRTYGG